MNTYIAFLASIVAETKAALGQHPLTELLHEPIHEPNEPKIQEEKIADEEGVDDRKTVGVESKFPKLGSMELASLREMDIQAIQNLLDRLPNGTEDVDPIRYQVSYHVMQAVMFVLMADMHSLATYDPDEDSYSLIRFCRGLERSLAYLDEYNNIKNLGQLVVAIKRAVAKDPEKYWDSSRKP